MKKILIIILVLASLLLCSCNVGDEIDRLFEREPNKVSIALVSCSTVSSYQSISSQTVTPASGNQFKKVVVNITNNYNSAVYYSYGNINYFKVVLANNHEYTDESATDNWQIMPGATVQVTTYFEIQEGESLNGASLSFVFLDPSNIIYTQRTTITLGSSIDV